MPLTVNVVFIFSKARFVNYVLVGLHRWSVEVLKVILLSGVIIAVVHSF